MLQTDTIANALAGAMLPFASEKVTSLKTTPAMASQPGIGIGEAADLVGNLNVPMDVFTETIPVGFKPNKELISAITGLGKETLDELSLPKKVSQMLLQNLRELEFDDQESFKKYKSPTPLVPVSLKTIPAFLFSLVAPEATLKNNDASLPPSMAD